MNCVKFVAVVLFLTFPPQALWGKTQKTVLPPSSFFKNSFQINSAQLSIDQFWKSLELIGTIILKPSEEKFAFIKNVKNSNLKKYTIGARLTRDIIIVNILKRSVILKKNGFSHTLELRTGTSGSSDAESGYLKLSATEWKINPRKIFSGLADVAKLFSGIKIDKATNIDRSKGIRINELSEDHLLKKIGFQELDIVEEVNGKPVDNIGKLIDSFWEMNEQTEVKISLNRHGEKKELTYYVGSSGFPSYSRGQVKQAAQNNGLMGVAVNVSW